MSGTEVRLLVDTYLDSGEITFTPAEVRQLIELSAAHPAYVQRAAFHLFQSKLDPSVDWRTAYLVEARSRPIPGAPLPPAIFEGQPRDLAEQSSYGEVADARAATGPQQLALPEARPVLALIVPLLIVTLLFLLTGNWTIALVAAVAGLVAAALWLRPRARGR